MSFWMTNEGEAISQTATYEAPSGGGNYVFADGSTIAGVIEDIKWDSFNGGLEFINYRISVMQPTEDANGVKIANRKIFAKLMINGKDQSEPEKRIKEGNNAKRMLAAIATNAGGGLFAVHGDPTTEQLQQHLMMKPMTFRLGRWELNGKTGNWVQAVGAYKAAYEPVSGTTEQSHTKAQPATAAAMTYDQGTDIPF